MINGGNGKRKRHPRGVVLDHTYCPGFNPNNIVHPNTTRGECNIYI
jgi:hypothetical protein